ncbi:MAG: glycerol-3-phosphate dehydrogenase, partial [Aestuariivirga sp.]|nr:glycerol-3-phosphate dehydrogenase [Aestuariivirga sp.]
RSYPFLGADNARRLFRAYGTDAEKMLEGARSAADMGQSFGPISQREVEWLKANEWARSADDILWRRSKLGLHMSQDEQDALRAYMAPAMEAAERKRAGV